MNYRFSQTIALLVLIISPMISSCDQDPFNFSYKKIASGYYLQRWEDGKIYYLQTEDTRGKTGGGILDGTINRIGWNSEYIVAEKQPTFSGEKGGWFVIHIGTKKIEGPISEKALNNRPSTKNLILLEPKDAWEKLG